VADSEGPELNTVAMLGRAYSLLGFKDRRWRGRRVIPAEAVTFGGVRADQAGGLAPDGTGPRRQHDPQAMGALVDELEQLGYVERRPDPTDRRAKAVPTPAWPPDSTPKSTPAWSTATGYEPTHGPQ
jgi:hypothetical protein